MNSRLQNGFQRSGLTTVITDFRPLTEDQSKQDKDNKDLKKQGQKEEKINKDKKEIWDKAISYTKDLVDIDNKDGIKVIPDGERTYREKSLILSQGFKIHAKRIDEVTDTTITSFGRYTVASTTNESTKEVIGVGVTADIYERDDNGKPQLKKIISVQGDGPNGPWKVTEQKSKQEAATRIEPTDKKYAEYIDNAESALRFFKPKD